MNDVTGHELGRGIAATGLVERDAIKGRNNIEIVGRKDIATSTYAGVKRLRKLLDKVTAGEGIRSSLGETDLHHH